MKRLKEQQDMLEQIRMEETKLFYELEEIKKAYAQKNRVLAQKANAVLEVIRFDFEEAIQIICYLVSLVEGKEYTYHERELPLIEYTSGNSKEDFGWCYVSLECYNSQNFKNKIKLQYICNDEEAARRELDDVINGVHARGFSIYDREPLPRLYELLTTPANNYVQINIHNGHSAFFESDNGHIEFVSNDAFIKQLPITLINYSSKICDPNFMYIVDFMNYLSVMKLEKEDFTLSMEEMKAYARDYAEKVKEEKLEKSQILKKVVVEV